MSKSPGDRKPWGLRPPRAAAAVFVLALFLLAIWWFGGAGAARRLERLSTRDLVLRSLQEPGNGRVQLLLGQRMERMHNWDSAIDAYQHAAAGPSTAADAYAGLARAYIAEGNLQLASQATKQGLRSDPHSPSVLNAAAQVALAQGRWLLARDDFLNLTQLNAGDADAWKGLAIADLSIHRPELAREAAAHAAKLLPADSDLEIIRGRSELDAGAPQAGVPFLLKAVQTAPTDPQAWTYLGAAQLGGGDLASAERSLKNAQRLAPDAVPPLLNLARLYETAGKKRQAIAMYRRVLELDPKDLGAMYHLSQLLQSAGRPGEAEEIRQEFLRSSDYRRTTMELENRIGRLLAARAPAASELPGLYLRLGLLHARNKNHVDALRVLNRARQLYPRDVPIQRAYQDEAKKR